jgi:hypothetical protein
MHNPEGEFMLYGDAYHEAAKDLLRASLASRSNNGIRSCPIVFLYRHALELHLKAILIHGNGILRLEGKEESNPKALDLHDLTILLAAVEPILDFMGWKDDSFVHGSIKSYEQCKAVIEDFNKIDRGSYTFRYPVQKMRNNSGEREASVGHHFAFDVQRVACLLDPVLEMLSAAAYTLDHYCDCMCEAIGEAEQEARAYCGSPDYEPPDY